MRIVPGGLGTTYIHERFRSAWRVPFRAVRSLLRAQVRAAAALHGWRLRALQPQGMILELLAEGCGAADHAGATASATGPSSTTTTRFSRWPKSTPISPICRRCRTSRGQRSGRGCAASGNEAAQTHFEGDFRGRKVYLCGPLVMIDARLDPDAGGACSRTTSTSRSSFSAADAQQVRSPLFKRI